MLVSVGPMLWMGDYKLSSANNMIWRPHHLETREKLGVFNLNNKGRRKISSVSNSGNISMLKPDYFYFM